MECCLSVGCQYSNKKITEINIEESKIHRDNGPILTLASSARWSGIFSKFSAARGRDPVAASLMENLLIKNAGKKCDFGNEPIELAEFLHVFRFEQANQQSLLAFFRIFS